MQLISEIDSKKLYAEAAVKDSEGQVIKDTYQGKLTSDGPITVEDNELALDNIQLATDDSLVAYEKDGYLVLGVDSSVIEGKQDVLTAGPGIDLSSNTVSANISTLTTDQIIAIKEALGVDETVLWEGDVSSGSVTLSESASNFSRLKVYGRTNDKWAVYTEVYTDVTMFSLIGMWGSSTRVQFKTAALQNNDTSIRFTQSSVIKFTSVANEVTPEYNLNQVYVTKIIGVGRKTGGN